MTNREFVGRYLWVGEFLEDLAPASEMITIMQHGKTVQVRREFHIRRDGEPAYAERYYRVGPFCNGRAVVQIDVRWYNYIGWDGRLVLPYNVTFAENFACDIARVSQDQHRFYIDTEGRHVRDCYDP
jgi:hypothetical protein